MVENCYVYFIQETYTRTIRGECAVKIGLAVDPLRRVRELQTGNARRLHLLMKIGPMSDKRAAAIERKLHKRFKRWRLVGEWFEPRVIKMMEYNMSDLEYETEVEIFSPLENKQAVYETETQKNLDRKSIAEARHRL